MTLRCTARLLVVVMLLASGRLLACGWECLDEVASPAVASCHQESVPAPALNGEASHACLPEVAEPRVRLAKLAGSQSLVAAPLVATLVAPSPMAGSVSDRRHASRPRFESPHLPGFSILRV